jgi:hypothetical protein
LGDRDARLVSFLENINAKVWLSSFVVLIVLDRKALITFATRAGHLENALDITIAIVQIAE